MKNSSERRSLVGNSPSGILRPMAVEALFTQALGLTAPWKVVSAEFDPAAKSLELVLDFAPGSRFTDPESGESCPVHDTVQPQAAAPEGVFAIEIPVGFAERIGQPRDVDALHLGEQTT